MYDLHTISRMQDMGGKRAAHHDFLINFHSDTLALKTKFSDQPCCGQPIGDFFGIAVQ